MSEQQRLFNLILRERNIIDNDTLLVDQDIYLLQMVIYDYLNFIYWKYFYHGKTNFIKQIY